MASTFAAFLLRYKFFMAAKELAIFPTQLSVDRKLQADKSLQEKRKIKKASASQKLNLATAHFRPKNRSIWTIQPTIKTLKLEFQTKSGQKIS